MCVVCNEPTEERKKKVKTFSFLSAKIIFEIKEEKKEEERFGAHSVKLGLSNFNAWETREVLWYTPCVCGLCMEGEASKFKKAK